MPLYIRDDDVKRLADQLAESRGCNVTEAVRSALSEALNGDHARRAERKRDIEHVLARFDRTPQLRPGLTDADLYDETGSPSL